MGDASADLIAEDAQTREGLLLALVLWDLNQRRGGSFGLGRAEHLFVGFELEFEGAVAIGQEVVFGLGGAQLLLGGLVLLLEGGH